MVVLEFQGFLDKREILDVLGSLDCLVHLVPKVCLACLDFRAPLVLRVNLVAPDRQVDPD